MLYGLEVCQALRLPADFLERTREIRGQLAGIADSPLQWPKSRYNAAVLKGLCAVCGRAPAVDTHHLVPQESANASGRIGGFHKNHGANLMPLCKACHDAHHNGHDVAQRRALSVTGGTVLTAYNPE